MRGLGAALLAAASLCGCSFEVEPLHSQPRDTSARDSLLSERQIVAEKPGDRSRMVDGGSRVTYDYRLAYAGGPLIHEGRLTTTVFGYGGSQIEGAVAHGLGAGGHRVLELAPEATLHCDQRVCDFDGVPYRRDRGSLEVEVAIVDTCVPRELVLWRGKGIWSESSIPWGCE